MTQSEFEKALSVLYRQRMQAAREEIVASMTLIAGSRSKKRSSSTAGTPKRKVGRRRSSEELDVLAEKLVAAVSEHSGETMMRLAEVVGSSTDELRRPMTLLRRAGRVRTTGEKSQTRYFPM